MKIIYLGHHALGDVVMKIPAIRYLINKFGNESVYFTVRDNSVKDFLINHTPLLKDNFLIYNNGMSVLEKFSLIRYIRNLNFDYFILPPTINNKNGKFLFQLSNSKKLISKPFLLINILIFSFCLLEKLNLILFSFIFLFFLSK